MGRALSIWLPRLPLDRRRRLGDPRVDGEFAIAAETGNAWLITHPSAAAEAAGVLAGLSVADARAVCPNLATAPADPARERALLTASARWADRLSPRVALDGPDGLLLDITGCAHLFGGEAAMGRHCRDLLEQLAMASRAGIADTKGAARALARHAADTPAVATPGGTAGSLARSHYYTDGYPPFDSAVLKNVSFAKVKFCNCDFRNARYIIECDFSGAKGLETCVFDDEVRDELARNFPDEFDESGNSKN